MATTTTLALRAIRQTEKLVYNNCVPAVNHSRRLRKQKMAAMGFTSGKSYRRYRLALNRDYRSEGLSD